MVKHSSIGTSTYLKLSSWMYENAITIFVVKLNFIQNFISQSVVKLQIISNNQRNSLKTEM